MNNSKNSKLLINTFIVFAFFSFCLIIYRLSYLGLSKKVDGINLKDFADDRSLYSSVLKSKRGTIYDSLGNALAQNVSSYTLIAYLNPARSKDKDKLFHVEDKELTAEKLSTVIDMSKEDILSILNQDGLYQVEFGFAGKNLTTLEKEKIEALELPGIDFIEDEKRYYPNGDFASYVLGYARSNEDEDIAGEMGIELLLNDVLSGTDGYISYQQDVNGYKIPGTKEQKVLAEDGYDVYLTIDSNIQFFVEQAVKSAYEKYKPEWMTVVVADAKSGKILASSQSPSFDPNTLDITNWIDYSVSSFEPGSIMKIYTYMAALENGTYNGKETFNSGHFEADDGTNIYDWNREGFGDITYDQGFAYSSNVGIINIINNFINRKILQDYFLKLGFGEKTGITLANESSGKIKFKYQTEVYNAGFGQGITTTPMQHIRALTSIANNGVMLNPYIIDKVLDKDGNVVFEGTRTEVSQVASYETVEKIKELMYNTVNSDLPYATGRSYALDGYDLIGKTGTAQLVNEKTGYYYSSDYYTLRSFVGMWPKDDPEVIIYVSAKKPAYGSSRALYETVKSIVLNTSKYLKIFDTSEEKDISNYTVENYVNEKTSVVREKLDKVNEKYMVIGNGEKVIKQYPNISSIINKNDIIILLTDDEDSYVLPDIKGFSKKQAQMVCNILEINCTFDGYGYVSSQSVSNIKVTKGMEVVISLKDIY